MKVPVAESKSGEPGLRNFILSRGAAGGRTDVNEPPAKTTPLLYSIAHTTRFAFHIPADSADSGDGTCARPVGPENAADPTARTSVAALLAAGNLVNSWICVLTSMGPVVASRRRTRLLDSPVEEALTQICR